MGTYEKAQIQSYVELKRVTPESVRDPTGDLNNCDRRATITEDGRPVDGAGRLSRGPAATAFGQIG